MVRLGELKEVIADHFESHFNQNQAIRLIKEDCKFKFLNEESAMLLERFF